MHYQTHVRAAGLRRRPLHHRSVLPPATPKPVQPPTYTAHLTPRATASHMSSHDSIVLVDDDMGSSTQQDIMTPPTWQAQQSSHTTQPSHIPTTIRPRRNGNACRVHADAVRSWCDVT